MITFTFLGSIKAILPKTYGNIKSKDFQVLTHKKNLQLLIKNFLNEEVSMACFDHNQTIMDPRNCVYQEYEAIVALAETEIR